MYRYPLLLLFITFFASIYTFILYSITNNPWASVFLTSAAAIIFILENMDLHTKLEESNNEIEIIKKTSQLTMMPKLNELQNEIKLIKLYITEQSVHKNRMHFYTIQRSI
jgi:hypothetical protein